MLGNTLLTNTSVLGNTYEFILLIELSNKIKEFKIPFKFQIGILNGQMCKCLKL